MFAQAGKLSSKEQKKLIQLNAYYRKQKKLADFKIIDYIRVKPLKIMPQSTQNQKLNNMNFSMKKQFSPQNQQGKQNNGFYSLLDDNHIVQNNADLKNDKIMNISVPENQQFQEELTQNNEDIQIIDQMDILSNSDAKNNQKQNLSQLEILLEQNQKQYKMCKDLDLKQSLAQSYHILSQLVTKQKDLESKLKNNQIKNDYKFGSQNFSNDFTENPQSIFEYFTLNKEPILFHRQIPVQIPQTPLKIQIPRKMTTNQKLQNFLSRNQKQTQYRSHDENFNEEVNKFKYRDFHGPTQMRIRNSSSNLILQHEAQDRAINYWKNSIIQNSDIKDKGLEQEMQLHQPKPLIADYLNHGKLKKIKIIQNGSKNIRYKMPNLKQFSNSQNEPFNVINYDPQIRFTSQFGAVDLDQI